MNADEVVKHILFNGHLYERCCEGSHSVRGKVVEVVALSGVLVPQKEDELWKCPHCGHDKSWFDRSIEINADGEEIGMGYRCEKCGRRDDESKPLEEKESK